MLQKMLVKWNANSIPEDLSISNCGWIRGEDGMDSYLGKVIEGRWTTDRIGRRSFLSNGYEFAPNWLESPYKRINARNYTHAIGWDLLDKIEVTKQDKDFYYVIKGKDKNFGIWNYRLEDWKDGEVWNKDQNCWIPETPKPLEPLANRRLSMSLQKLEFTTETYKRIDKKVVLLERENKLYYQAASFNDFYEVRVCGNYNAKTIPFDNILPNDKLYAFDEITDPVKLIKTGQCLDSTNLVSRTAEECRFTKVLSVLKAHKYVGCSDGYKKYRVISNPANGDTLAIIEKNGNQNNSFAQSMGTRSGLYKLQDFVYTDNEYEFFNWLFN